MKRDIKEVMNKPEIRLRDKCYLRNQISYHAAPVPENNMIMMMMMVVTIMVVMMIRTITGGSLFCALIREHLRIF